MEALKELGLRASVFMSVNWDNPMGLSGLLEGQSHTKYGHHPYPLLAGLVQRSPSPSPFLPTPAPSLSLPLPHRPGPWKILWPRFSPLWAVTVAGGDGQRRVPSPAPALLLQGHTASQGQSWGWAPPTSTGWPLGLKRVPVNTVGECLGLTVRWGVLKHNSHGAPR